MKNIVYIAREKCCVCGGNDLRVEQKIRDFDSGLGDFDLVKCCGCGMYYTSPYPNAATLPYLYSARNTRNFDTNNADILLKIKVFLAKKSIAKIIKGSEQPLRVADFGCGNGLFSWSFQQVLPSAKVCAVDFASTVPSLLAKLEGGKARPQYMHVEEFYKNNQQYDIIFLRHVLEHAENPLNMLNALLKKLTKNGFIYVEVPNIKNGLRLFWNKYLPSYYPPYHLVHFTPENFKILCSKLEADTTFSHTQMPLMSNIISNMSGQPLNNFHRILGIFLYPIQWLLCLKRPSVLVAKIKNKA